MAIAEALAHELPVLTTTATPWPMLEQRQCGWRVAPTAEAVAEGLRLALDRDAASMRAMGAAGRELVAASFGWPSIAAQFIGLYESVIAGARRSNAAA